jgi:hypothetical protein
MRASTLEVLTMGRVGAEDTALLGDAPPEDSNA